MQLTGIHHLTADSVDTPGNVRFYSMQIGMRLVKKTVNRGDDSEGTQTENEESWLNEILSLSFRGVLANARVSEW